MTTKELFRLIKSDKRRVKNFYYLKLFFPHPDSYIFWFRLNSYFQDNNYLFRFVGVPFAIIHYVYSLLLGIQIPSGTKVGGSFSIKHYSCIVIARNSRIGNNCTIHHGVTIGRTFGGKKEGYPIVGNNVICFPGAKVFGNSTDAIKSR